MKRIMILALCALLAIGALTGCSGTKETKPAQADNDILTYEKIDPSKTTLFVATSGNEFPGKLDAEFEKLNPDVQVVLITMTGGSGASRPMSDWVANGLAPDVMLAPATYFNAEEAVQYFENLSSNAVVQNYEAEALNRLAVNGNIYFLPGPSKINCMLYNKTMFDQYGWQIPTTFDEFVALCAKIREDTNGTVQPWNPNAKYYNELKIAFEAFVYQDLFAGLENRTWYEEFRAGKATFKGHMEPYYDMIQTLIDNKILLEEHFSYSATTRGNEFVSGQMAMYNYTIGSTRTDNFDVQYMPFPTTEGSSGYVVDSIGSAISMPKKERTEKQRDAAQRYLEFFSSVEGQRTFIDDLMMFSNVKDVPLPNAEYMTGVADTIEQGRYFSAVDFSSIDGKKSNISFRTDALDMLKGTKTAADCIAAADAQPFREDAVAEAPEVLGTVAEDFNILDTSFFFADMYREKAGADIGLIVHEVAYRGNLMRMFKGDLITDSVIALKPRSFDNKSTLVKVAMTGQQLMDALNDPVNNNKTDVPVYAFSGLKCEVAPWNPSGEKMLSVKLADGTAIDPAKTYTVAFWDGTVKEEYITEVLESYEGNWEALMTETLAAKKTIKPAKDGRITLKWD